MPQSSRFQLGDKRFLRAHAFHRIACSAQQLKIIEVIATAPALRDDVVDGHVAEREHYLTATTNAFLAAIERVPVRLIAGEVALVRPAWDVLAVLHIIEQRPPVVAEPLENQLGRQRRQVDPDPLALKPVGGDKGRGATAERIEDSYLLRWSWP